MITHITLFLWFTLLVLSMSSANPVKVTILLILMRILNFFIIHVQTASTWFPIIFLIMFTGGILMMFIILSSILPNEPAKKIKNFIIIIVIFIATTPFMAYASRTTFIPSTKWFLTSSPILWGTITLVSAYFLSFITILSKNKSSLRSRTCQRTKNFVNFLTRKWQLASHEKKRKQLEF